MRRFTYADCRLLSHTMVDLSRVPNVVTNSTINVPDFASLDKIWVAIQAAMSIPEEHFLLLSYLDVVNGILSNLNSLSQTQTSDCNGRLLLPDAWEVYKYRRSLSIPPEYPAIIDAIYDTHQGIDIRSANEIHFRYPHLLLKFSDIEYSIRFSDFGDGQYLDGLRILDANLSSIISLPNFIIDSSIDHYQISDFIYNITNAKAIMSGGDFSSLPAIDASKYRIALKLINPDNNLARVAWPTMSKSVRSFPIEVKHRGFLQLKGLNLSYPFTINRWKNITTVDKNDRSSLIWTLIFMTGHHVSHGSIPLISVMDIDLSEADILLPHSKYIEIIQLSHDLGAAPSFTSLGSYFAPFYGTYLPNWMVNPIVQRDVDGSTIGSVGNGYIYDDPQCFIDTSSLNGSFTNLPSMITHFPNYVDPNPKGYINTLSVIDQHQLIFNS